MMCIWQSAPAALVPPTTSYANSGGIGNRTASITVTRVGGGAPGSGTVDNLVDGGFANNSTDSVFWSTANANGMTLEFDFGSKVYINEFKLYQAGAATWGGNWIWEAFDTGTSAWVGVSAGFTWVAVTGSPQTVTGTISDAAGYQKYRLRNTSVPAATPFVSETEFKIAPGAV